MYLSFYGLAEKPFSQTPDPKFLYWNDAYRETIAALRYGIQERKGFVTMIGEAGTGKTTLLRKLLDDLGPDAVSVFLFNPNASFEEILEYMLSELGIPAASGRKLAMLQRLNDFLLAAFQEGKNTILLIDEAQDLETEVLESLRLLSNLETAKEKILQIVLSGQPELATRLAQPNLRQLKQRIAVRCRLEPLGRHELADYIAARLSIAGGRPDLFAPATLDPIWEFARGIPRLINAVCDNALLVGYALGRQTIDTEVIGEVVSDLGRIDVPIVPVAAPIAEPARAALAPAAAAPLPPPAVVAGPAPIPEPPIAASPPVPDPATEATRLAAADIAASAPPPAPSAVPPRATLLREPLAAKPPRRSPGLVFVVAILLVLAGAGAWAALRWPEIQPQLQGLIGSPRVARVEPPAAAAAVAPRAPDPIPVAAPAARVEPAPAPVAAVDAPSPVASAAAPQATASPKLVDATSAVAPEPVARVQLAPAPAAAAPAPTASAPEAVAMAASNPPSARLVTAAVEPSAPATQGRQDLQPPRRVSRSGRKILVQRGDTLMNLAMREYGNANYTVLDVLRGANPGIQDVNRIIAGSEIVFPDPGPGTRVHSSGDDVSVLVVTTPVLVQAQEIQRMAGSRYQLPVDLEPIPLGDGHNLYRVSLRQVPDKQQALEIAESLGSILRDPS